jgi:histidine triad (HIT) family protein
MGDCVFCGIVAGVKYEDKIWEDEEFLAVLDINPCAKGHLLVIPKKHYRWVWDIEGEEYLRYMDKVCYLAGVLRKAFETDCVQMAIVGMDVFHCHVHLLPRVEGDGFAEIPVSPMVPKPSVEEMKKIRDKIKEYVN